MKPHHLLTLWYVLSYAAILAADSEDHARLAELLADADLLWKRLSERYLMVVLEALRGWLDVCEGSVGGIEKIVQSVTRSRTEGETLHLTYTLLLLARACGMVGEFRQGRAAAREGSRGHTSATSAISRPSCGESTVSWRIAAGIPKPPPLLCAVPSRSPSLKGRAGWSCGRSTPSPVDFPIQTQREQLGDLIETIPSGHNLPAFRAATRLLSKSG